ncbi:MAG: choice-of-anchor D domain-containing protein, partial [Pedobacter sp.]
LCGNTSLAYTHGSGQPETDVAYFWQTSATGTDTTHPTSSPFVASTGATYHVRAKSTLGNCWSTGTVSQAVTVVLANAITTEPTNQTVSVGTTATFTVVASNATSYQWQVNTGSGWNNVSTGTGGTTASYTTPTTTLAMSGYQYKVIVSGTSPCVAIESAVRTLTASPVITYANLQYPASHSMEEGSTVAVYGRVYAESVTEAAGASGTITAEFGYSATNTNPNTWTNWTSGTYNVQVGNDDEYTGNLGTGLTPGTYYYATRFRIGAGTYVYGGTSGVWSSTANSGVLTITSNLVDWGNYQYPTTGSITLGDAYNVYGQVYEAGNTNAAGQGGNITAEAGYSTTNTNPSTWTNWFPATFNTDAGNNDEYSRNIGTSFSSGGTYYLAFRYKKTGSTEYVYGGTNGIWNNDNATVTVLTPKEINIKQGATDIASNGTYGFGNQVVTTSSTTITFTIQNTGGVVLNLSGIPRVDITGSNASEFTINQATLPATVAPNSSETFTVTFTPTSLGAKTAQLSIANDDSNENPYLITLTGTGTASGTSNIIANAGFTNSPINYLNYINSNITAANSFELGQFIIQDGGGSPDGDNLGTTLSSLSLLVGNVAYLERIALYDGVTEIAELPATLTTVFTGLSLTAADGGTKTFSIRASFKTAVTDNQRIIVTVSGATAAAGSTFGTISASTSSAGLTDNVIQVTADRLAFVQQPSNTGINVAMTPAVTVSANDVNGNRDLDFTGSVEVLSDGTLTGGSTTVVSAVSGVATFSNLVHSAVGTGLELLAGHTTWNVLSNGFNITSIAYSNGDFMTKTGGTWTNNGTGTATWYKRIGGIWDDTTQIPNGTTGSYTVYITENVEVPDTGVTQLATSKIYITNNKTLTYKWSSNQWTFQNIIVDNGATLKLEGAGRFTVASSGNFEVLNGGTFNYSNTSTNASSTGASSMASSLWNGTEIFHPNSNVVIGNHQTGSSNYFLPAAGNLSTHTENGITAYFGNIIFDASVQDVRFTSTNLSSTTTYLTAGNFEIRPYSITSGSQNLFYGAGTWIIGKNLIIGANSTSAVASSTVVVKAATNSGSVTLNVKGNVVNLSNNTLNLSNSTSGSMILNMDGDLEIGSTGKLISVASSNPSFNFSGSGNGLTDATTQTINFVNNSTASNIIFNVNSGAYAKLINQDFTLGTNSTFTVSNNGILDFGFDNASTPNALNILGTGSGVTFTAQAGSTLKITSDAGITTTATPLVGNVRTTSRTFTALGNFHYIGKNGQVTGTGLPTNVNNLLVHNEVATNNLTISNANVNVNGLLTMEQGNIVSRASNLLSIGANTTTGKGTLSRTSGVVKGTTNGNGVLRRYFSGTNANETTGLFPLGTTGNQER